jgi:hypothetical protein
MKGARTTIVALSFLFVSAAALSAFPADALPEPVLHEASTFAVDAFIPTEIYALADLWAVDPVPVFDAAAGTVPVLDMNFVPAASYAQAASVSSDASGAEGADLTGLLNNEYYRESIRLKKLATDAFDYGDYDLSAGYSADAAAAALRSDEYVALRLKIRAADSAIAKAKERLDWATSIGAARSFAVKYAAASAAYDGAVAARGEESYDSAISLAQQVLAELALVRDVPPLPALYKVRPWAETRDCFWNIAAYPWVYGDPTKWDVLYQANKAKLRHPDNPNLLHVGTVISIPSLNGEYRDGTWEKGKAYSAFSGR